ncbi:MAG: hypothetical protein KJN90_12955 [Gammaproteobacteria bacterium]|nr:hypothetical protein [Gammaproteobacteria bacterium]
MAINELHKIYPNRNHELRTVAKAFFEFGKTIAREPSAAHSNGLDEHAIKRQDSYIAYAKSMVDALAAKPIPDNPATHPLNMPIDFSEQYITFTQDLNGNQVPLNESTQMLAEKWLLTAVEIAKSQSAALAGSLVTFDNERAQNNLDTLEKMLNEVKERPFLDLPETAEPGSSYGPRSGSAGAR